MSMGCMSRADTFTAGAQAVRAKEEKNWSSEPMVDKKDPNVHA
jgi:hypothetical protein